MIRLRMGEKPKILVVDDERFNVKMIADLLRTDYKVMAAISSEQALKAARSANPPDLVLLDVMMPGMDGYEVCRQLKSDAATCDIPVIFVSGADQTADQRRAFEEGAVAFLTKPVSPDALLDTVRAQLGNT